MTCYPPCCVHVSICTTVWVARTPAPPLCPAPRYEMEMKEKQSQAEGEDMSDMVAEHVAKQKVRTATRVHEDLVTAYEAVLSAAGKGFHG